MHAAVSLDYTDINLALNKPAIQTSTYDGQEASRAVDGLVGVGAASCTLAHSHSSWAVDLGAAYDVGHVTVTHDANAIHGRPNQVGPIMGSLKSPYRTFCLLSIDTLAQDCLFLRKARFLCAHFGDRQTHRDRCRFSVLLVFL